MLSPVLPELATIPGVEKVGASHPVAGRGAWDSWTNFTITGHTDPPNNLPAAEAVAVMPDFFYEKVIKVKADVAALLMFDLRPISTEKFALGSLRSDDRQLGRPTASPLLSVFSRNLASFLPCCIDLGWCVARLSRAPPNGGVHLDP
jgi:hypothetical protein